MDVEEVRLYMTEEVTFVIMLPPSLLLINRTACGNVAITLSHRLIVFAKHTLLYHAALHDTHSRELHNFAQRSDQLQYFSISQSPVHNATGALTRSFFITFHNSLWHKDMYTMQRLY